MLSLCPGLNRGIRIGVLVAARSAPCIVAAGHGIDAFYPSSQALIFILNSENVKRKREFELAADINTFADQRKRFKPVDPKLLDVSALAQTAEGTGGALQFMYEGSLNSTPSEARWHFWLAIAGCVFFFPRQLYLGTDFEGQVNCVTGAGSNDQ